MHADVQIGLGISQLLNDNHDNIDTFQHLDFHLSYKQHKSQIPLLEVEFNYGSQTQLQEVKLNYRKSNSTTRSQTQTTRSHPLSP